MSVCDVCKKERLVIVPHFINSEYVEMCAICALKQRNEFHGLPEGTLFHGEMANELWEREVAHEGK